ncbi:MAG TPA: chloride channel protein [Pirellulales bacterium]|jgi:H+/Cl- antiporter ClcA|nr:chloride channel protein [Pirellulales bacterium]
MDGKGDFTADNRLLWLAGLAIPIGLVCAVVAMALQRLIGLFTNLFYFQHFSIPDHLVAPGEHTLGWVAIFVPVVGGLIVGLMARYGSERIRGHGIPEAIEAILIGSSRMQPRVAVLKPLSSAVSIGSGGPFGAEGPIIMTGGALGSIVAQVFHMTPAERKTLLVAGAAGGMAATFGTPVAAVLLAVELLLFEWKPRSLIPVALASATATLMRPYLGLGAMPMIPVPAHLDSPTLTTLLSALLVGLSGGILSLALTSAVYASENAFHRLPIHWMWWPALGGLVVGIGGFFEPRALGVGYQVIEGILQGKYVAQTLIGLMVVKGLIWSIALGSGTSGGVLAPLLMMGSMLGVVEATLLPGHDARLWALVCMAAVMGGTMRAPLTGVIFGLETTYDVRALLPLLIGSIVAHGFTVLVMKRSILTEKVARRGYHVSQEYSVDPLERLLVSQVMSADIVSVPAALPIKELVLQYFSGHGPKKHQGYPVVDESDRLLGVVTKTDLLDEWTSNMMAGGDGSDGHLSHIIAFDLVNRSPITISPEETCRTAAERMAQAGVGRLLVVRPQQPSRVIGVVTRSDLLKSRARHTEEEFVRERFLGARLPAAAKGELPKSA